MTAYELTGLIKRDLSAIRAPTDFDLVVKDYSKRYNGRYNPNTRRIILYRYSDSDCTKPLPYSDLLKVAIHEVTHHHQWCHDESFRRAKGVMHDIKFKQLESILISRAEQDGLLDKEVLY